MGCYQQSKCGSLPGGLKDILFNFVKIPVGSQKHSNFLWCCFVNWKNLKRFLHMSCSMSSQIFWRQQLQWMKFVKDWGTHYSTLNPLWLLFHGVPRHYYKHQAPPKWIGFCAGVWGWTQQVKKIKAENKCSYLVPAPHASTTAINRISPFFTSSSVGFVASEYYRTSGDLWQISEQASNWE